MTEPSFENAAPKIGQRRRVSTGEFVIHITGKRAGGMWWCVTDAGRPCSFSTEAITQHFAEVVQ